jgi:DNA invertase Pin-like site-specific DNA recombinase
VSGETTSYSQTPFGERPNTLELESMTDISKSQEEKKVVYLYSRCSSIAQADSGESIQRQVEQTTAWVTRMFPTYDISTRSFILAAVSGFSGESIDLGGFFKSCESGEIVYGKSAIAFEALDRLGRLEPSKMRVFVLGTMKSFRYLLTYLLLLVFT